MDGWALTMLSRENVGYASTCNSVGQTAGYFMGNVLFLALESADFCNKYLRVEPKDTGIVTLSGITAKSRDKMCLSGFTRHGLSFAILIFFFRSFSSPSYVEVNGMSI